MNRAFAEKRLLKDKKTSFKSAVERVARSFAT